MKKILFAVTLFALTFSGFAQQKWSEKEYQSAYRLMTTLHVEAFLNEEIEYQINKYMKRMPFLQKSKPKFQAFFKKYASYPAVKQDMAEILLKNFTADELNKIADFCASPEGQKILSKAKTLEKQFEQYAKQAINQHIEEFQQLIQDELSSRMERR